MAAIKNTDGESPLQNRPIDAFPERRLRTARDKVGITQEELALRLGTYITKISRYENGNPAIKMWQLPIWAKALNIPVSDLLPDDWLSDIEEQKILQTLRRLSKEDRQHIAEIIDIFAKRNDASKD